MQVASARGLDGIPDELLVHIAQFVAADGLRDDAGGVVARVYSHIRALSGVSRQMHKAITILSVQSAIARVLGIALQQTVSTSRLLACVRADPALAPVKPESAESSAAIMSRLVDLSKAAEAARALLDPKHSSLVKPGYAGWYDAIIRLIESARPALRESLRKATVGLDSGATAQMYSSPDAVADYAIESLKEGPPSAVPNTEELRWMIRTFRDPEQRTRTIGRYGPLCIWHVAEIADFTGACAVEPGAPGFSSDLFWNTRSATTMTRMFQHNKQFKGYIGTWDVRNVREMSHMFEGSGIKDSGIANWNTKSLTDATSMFSGAELSAGLDLSRWRFASTAAFDHPDLPQNKRPNSRNVRQSFGPARALDSKLAWVMANAHRERATDKEGCAIL